MDLGRFLFSFFIFDVFFLKVLKGLNLFSCLRKRLFTAWGPFFWGECGRAVFFFVLRFSRGLRSDLFFFEINGRGDQVDSWNSDGGFPMMIGGWPHVSKTFPLPMKIVFHVDSWWKRSSFPLDFSQKKQQVTGWNTANFFPRCLTGVKLGPSSDGFDVAKVFGDLTRVPHPKR